MAGFDFAKIKPAALWARLTALFLATERRRAISFNIGWMFFDRVFRTGISALIIIWLARHLGPEAFGQYSFAISIIAIIAAMSGLGLHQVLVREIARAKGRPADLMGASFLAVAISSFLGAGITLLLAIFAAQTNDTFLLVAIAGLTLVFRITDPIRALFEARMQSKVTILADFAVFCLMAASRIFLLLTQADLIVFVWLLVVEAMLTACGLGYVFVTYAGFKTRIAGQFTLAIGLAKEAFPLALAGLGVILYMRIDQVMLGMLLDETSVGFYAAAVRISELWYFVPVIVTTSFFPQIAASKDNDPALYERLLIRLYMIMWVLSLMAICVIVVVGEQLMGLLYGAEYAAAGPILGIHAFAGLFVALGSARGKWLLSEGMHQFFAISIFAGALVNILANLVLIPLEGGVGAAKATILGYGFATVIMPLFFQPARKCFDHMFLLKISRRSSGPAK